ncbi:MAG: efflux RND transporter periplasmic adaptor subunit [Proteobacteria bacterium]|nr:efflux RND transporter periplasmic adaptor subunit [Pseudomonadota bacterium]
MRKGTLAALLALGAIAAGCGKEPEAKPEEVRPVRVLRVDAAAAARSIEFAGEVRPRYETRLAFRVGGKMVERLVEVGTTVRAGQPVARLDPHDLELAAASARTQIVQLEAERKFAEGDLRRYRELREKNFISQAELDRRVSTYDSIAARLEAARAQSRQAANQAGYAVLAADQPGVITAIEAEAGQVVAAGQTIARLARSGEVEVVVAVPETQREAFERAGAFSVGLNAFPGRSWKGRLRELSPLADPVTRTYLAKVTMLEPGGDVELGMSARVSAEVSAAERRIELPVSALYGKGDAMQVWLVEAVKDGIGAVRLQPVKTRGLAGDHVLVDSGLSSGDMVVVAGAQLLRAGQRVRVADPK